MAAYMPELPMGYRFCPIEEELITYYLAKKVFASSELPQDIIKEVDLYKYSPLELQESWASQKIYRVSNEKELFVQRERKYVNGNRPSRRAGNGTWRATTTEKKIFDENGNIIGYKNTLEYREDHGEGRKGEKTNCLMYEYKVASNNASNTSQVDDPMKMNEWTLCKIYLNKKNCRNLQNTTARPEETSHGQNLEHLQGGPRDIHNYVNDPDQLETHDVPNQIPHHHVQYYLNNMKYTQVTDQNLEETSYQNMEETYQNTPVFGLQITNSTSNDPSFSDIELTQAGPSNNDLNVNAPHQNQSEANMHNQIPISIDRDDNVRHADYPETTQESHQNPEENLELLQVGLNDNNIAPLTKTSFKLTIYQIKTPLNTDQDDHVHYPISLDNTQVSDRR